MLHPVHVANRHHGAHGVYVGRPTPIGNPFPRKPGEPRGATLVRYRRWLWAQLQSDTPARRAMERLLAHARERELTLVCSCAPAPCHAEIIRDALGWMDEADERG